MFGHANGGRRRRTDRRSLAGARPTRAPEWSWTQCLPLTLAWFGGVGVQMGTRLGRGQHMFFFGKLSRLTQRVNAKVHSWEGWVERTLPSRLPISARMAEIESIHISTKCLLFTRYFSLINSLIEFFYTTLKFVWLEC